VTSAGGTVDGLTEFEAGIARLDKGLRKTIRLAFAGLGETLIDDARPRVPKITGRARASLKVRPTRTLVEVVGGGSRAPYYPKLERRGRYLERAVRRHRDEVDKVMSKALAVLARSSKIEMD